MRSILRHDTPTPIQTRQPAREPLRTVVLLPMHDDEEAAAWDAVVVQRGGVA